MNSNKNKDAYVFSTAAQWLNGSYGPDGSSIGGTLGLTAAARVEFTLQNGKLMFSAPVALTKRRYESLYGWVRFVVGPRLYTLQFYTPTQQVPSTLSPEIQLFEAQAATPTFNAWREKLDQAAAQPADDQPIIAAEIPPALKAMSRRAIGKYQIIVGAVIAIALIVGVVVFFAGKSNFVSENTILIVAVCLGLIAPLAWLLMKTQRTPPTKTQTALSIPADQLALGPNDTLQPGTPPTGSFGWTEGRQLLWGLIIGAAIIVIGNIIGVLVK